MTTLAVNGGEKVRTQPWPKVGRRFGKEELQQLKEALEQNTLLYIYGNKTKQLCAKMAKVCGAKHVLACSSGSAAVHGAVKACGVGPGDEVITSPLTDAGTILGVVYEGGIPVFADTDPTSYNITAASIEKQISKRTRAVIVVHLAGVPADIKPIVRLCKRRKIKLIEDCAQSWGAMVDDRWVGTFGDIGTFSLNDYKHLSAGEGGLIVTDDEELYGTAWLGIDKGYDRALAQTMSMNTLVVLEIFHLFFIRNIHGTSLTWAAVRGTPVVWACVIGITAAQFAVTYLAPLQNILGTQAVPFLDGVLIVAVGAVFFALVETEKQMRLAFRRSGISA